MITKNCCLCGSPPTITITSGPPVETFGIYKKPYQVDVGCSRCFLSTSNKDNLDIRRPNPNIFTSILREAIEGWNHFISLGKEKIQEILEEGIVTYKSPT